MPQSPQLLPFVTDARGLLLVFLGFCFLIFVHELGHFIAAKLVGMKVTQFALGMGPALFSWRKGIGFRSGSTEPEFDARLKAYFANRSADQVQPRDGTTEYKPTPKEVDQATRELGLGETEYRVNYAIPVGGYVKMVGQEDLKPEVTGSDDERSFTRKPAWARAVVLSAGVVMNLIWAIIFFIVAFMAGVKMPPAIAGEVAPNSPAAQAYALGHEGDPAFKGIRLGDHILKVNGDDITDYTDLSMAAALTNPGSSMDVLVERPGVAGPLTFRVTPVMVPGEKFRTIGVDSPLALVVIHLRDSAPPPMNRVETGSTITAVAGQHVDTFAQYNQLMCQAKGNPVPVTFSQPSGKDVTVDLHAVPTFTADESGDPSLLGLMPATEIDAVVVNSPAEKAGVKPGDLIARLGSQSWPLPKQLVEIVAAHHGGPVDLTVWRDGKEIDLPATAPGGNGKLGIAPSWADDSPIIARTQANSPLASQELPAGSRLISVNGKPVNDFVGLAQVLANVGGEPLSIVYQKNLKDAQPTEVRVRLTAADLKEIQSIQWMAPILPYDLLKVPLAASDPVAAIRLGFRKTGQFMVQTYITLLRMVQGNLPPSEARGAVGIFQIGIRVAETGWSYLLFFLGLISVNLVVMNFLPIPILDGGQMLFLIIEKLKGSPVSIRTQSIATYIGLAIIGSLLLMTLYFDVGRIIYGG